MTFIQGHTVKPCLFYSLSSLSFEWQGFSFVEGLPQAEGFWLPCNSSSMHCKCGLSSFNMGSFPLNGI